MRFRIAALLLALLQCVVGQILRFHTVLLLNGTYSGLAKSAKNTLELAAQNLSATLPAGVSIQLEHLNSFQKPDISVARAVQAAAEGTLGVIGELASSNSLPMAIKLAETRTLQCSVSSSGALSKKNSRYFFRTIPEDSAQGNVLSSVIKAYGWTSVGIIYAGSSYAKGIADQLASDLSSSGDIKVIFYAQYDMDSYQTTEWEARDLITFVPYARAVGLFGPMYSWVCPETALGVPNAIASAIAQGDMVQADADALNGLLITSPMEGFGVPYDNLQAQYKDKYSESIQQYSGFYYDCLLCMVNFLTLYQSSTPGATWADIAAGNFPRDLAPLLNSSMQANTVGVSGKLIFNNNFDRIGAYELVNVYHGVSRTIGSTVDTDYKLVLTANATFFSGTHTIPSSDTVLQPNWYNYQDPLALVLEVLYALMMLITAASIMFVHMWRERPEVKALSPQFMMIMGGAMELAFATMFVSIGKQSTFTCNFRAWLFAISFGIIMGCLIAKTYRIWRVFANERLASPLGIVQILRMAGAFTLGEAMIMATWSAYSPLLPTLITDKATGTYNHICEWVTGNSAFVGAVFAYNAALAAVATYLAVATRSVPSKYSEAKYIAFTVYSLLIWCTLIIAVSFTSGTSSSLAFLIQSFGVLFVTSTTWALP
ncbi:hypothetical protein HDU89_000098 [Geranomyces variabilis]|nr:hypothetical protein HDU89_000098 [Geranomyces variabilis]